MEKKYSDPEFPTEEVRMFRFNPDGVPEDSRVDSRAQGLQEELLAMCNAGPEVFKRALENLSQGQFEKLEVFARRILNTLEDRKIKRS